MSRLMEYFNEVDKNAVMRAMHLADPQAGMRAFGLSATEQEAILSGTKLEMIKAAGLDADEPRTLHTPNIVYEYPAMHTPNTVFMPN